MQVIIDRFEGDYAVCEREDNEFIKLERNLIPAAAREGDVLSVNGGIIVIDESETAATRARIKRMADELWK